MKFYLKQRFAKGYEILDENEQVVYKVRPTFTFITTKVLLYDNQDNLLYKIQSKPFRILPCFKVYKGDEYVYTFKKKITFIKKRVCIKARAIEEKGNKYKLIGSFLGWSFYVACNGEKIFTIDKKEILKLTDRYLVDVLDEDKKELAIITGIIVNLIYHSGTGRR